jgi:hypothetical protein
MVPSCLPASRTSCDDMNMRAISSFVRTCPAEPACRAHHQRRATDSVPFRCYAMSTKDCGRVTLSLFCLTCSMASSSALESQQLMHAAPGVWNSSFTHSTVVHAHPMTSSSTQPSGNTVPCDPISDSIKRPHHFRFPDVSTISFFCESLSVPRTSACRFHANDCPFRRGATLPLGGLSHITQQLQPLRTGETGFVRAEKEIHGLPASDIHT